VVYKSWLYVLYVIGIGGAIVISEIINRYENESIGEIDSPCRVLLKFADSRVSRLRFRRPDLGIVGLGPPPRQFTFKLRRRRFAFKGLGA
jgi:hypothetical protein